MVRQILICKCPISSLMAANREWMDRWLGIYGILSTQIAAIGYIMPEIV